MIYLGWTTKEGFWFAEATIDRELEEDIAHDDPSYRRRIPRRRPSGAVYFAQRCNKERPYNGYWAGPGGHVEEGESPRAAAVRELEEETGLEIAPERLFLLCTRLGCLTPVSEKGTGIHYAMHYFGLDLLSDEIPLDTEPTKQIVWTPWIHGPLFETLDFPPGTRDAYDKMMRPGQHK